MTHSETFNKIEKITTPFIRTLPKCYGNQLIVLLNKNQWKGFSKDMNANAWKSVEGEYTRWHQLRDWIKSKIITPNEFNISYAGNSYLFVCSSKPQQKNVPFLLFYTTEIK